MIAKSLIAAACFAAAVCAPVAAQAANAFTTTAVNLRSGPDTQYPAVTVLPPNQNVNVIGCLDGWIWCDVAWGPYRGWVAGAYLQAYDGPTRSSFVRVAPRLGVPFVVFRFGEYWDSHYRARPFYRTRTHWEHWDYGNRRWRGDYRGRPHYDHRARPHNRDRH